MIRPIDLPVVISQAPLAQHMQFAAQSAPAVYQAFLSHLVVQRHEREKDQVEIIEKTEQTAASSREKNPQDGSSGGQSRHQEQHRDEEDHLGIPEKGEHIIDIKV